VNVRVGLGCDLHPLVEGRRLVLGGVEIEHERGASGHSDADAVAHAVTDALLGAAAMGDIGSHFPDDDPQYKDADSIELLRRVVEMLEAESWEIGNVDVTVILQRPKLAPYIQEMRKNLAAALGIDEGSVSIKAKTGEGLGPVGREEAVAAHAAVLLYQSPQ